MSNAPESTQLLLEDNTMLVNNDRKNGDTPLWIIVMFRVIIFVVNIDMR